MEKKNFLSCEGKGINLKNYCGYININNYMTVFITPILFFTDVRRDKYMLANIAYSCVQY